MMLFPDQPYVQGSRLYAAAGSQVFHSTNEAQDWQESKDALPNTEVRALVSVDHTGTIYAGTEGGVLRSTDGGQNWEQLTDNGLHTHDIWALAWQDNLLYAGISGAVFVIKDGDSSDWTQVGSGGLDGYNVTALAVDSTRGRVYAGTEGNGMFAIGPDLTTWQDINVGFPSGETVNTLRLNTLDGILYAGTEHAAAFRLDFTESNFWRPINNDLTPGLSVRDLVLDRRNGLVYAATAEGVFRSENNGDSWQEASSGFTSLDIFSLTLNPLDGALYAGTAVGTVFHSTDHGETWQPVASLPVSAPVVSLMYWSEPSRLAVSNPALEELQATHPDELGGQRYPWRVSLSPLTGLPVFLRTWLDSPLEIAADQDISPPISSLFNPLQIRAIFGLRDEFHKSLETEVRGGPIIRLGGPPGRQRVAICHLTWYQVCPNQTTSYPVMGGSVRVHGIEGDRRVAVTHSYFPISTYYFKKDEEEQIPDEPPLDAALSEIMKAADTMQQSLLPFITILLEQALARQDTQELMRLLALTEEELVAWRRWPISTARWLVQQPNLTPLGMRLTPLAERLAGLSRQVAQTKLAIIRGGDETISALDGVLPVEGAYRQVKQVQVTVPDQDPWLIDVDARSGQTLSAPWQPLLLAPYYQTSTEALPTGAPNGVVSDFLNQPTPPSQPTIQDLKTDLAKYVIDLENLLSGPDSEKATVAVQALRLYAYLRWNCGVKANSMPAVSSPLIKLMFDLQPDEQGMGFSYLDPLFPEIRLWRDSGNGITLANVPKVYTPARDPEVSLHEFTHVLLWLLNRDPWDTQEMLKHNPFGRALQEAYAMYLPRSLVALDNEPEFAQSWARAAYRDWINSQPDWIQSWVFPRRANQAASKLGDCLKVPNTYPTGRFSIAEMKDYYLVYEVGMILGRALADLRLFLGHQRTDWLAVQSYFYLHGRIANFELAIEGLLDADQKLNNETQLNQGSQPIWAGRGIAAGQGVYGFAQAPHRVTGQPVLIAATDAGIWQSPDQGLNWSLEVNNLGSASNPSTLTGVTAVAADNNMFYAAAALPPANSSTGVRSPWLPNIYSRRVNDTTWNPVGDWSSEAGNTIPSSLLWQNNHLFAATNRGVFVFDGWRWQRVGGANQDFTAVDIAPAILNSGNRLVACLPDTLRHIRVANTTGVGWAMPGGLFNNNASARPTAITAWPNPAGGSSETYVGTQEDGLWRIPVAANLTTLQVYDNTIGAVLALALSNDNRKLYIATDRGILEVGHPPPHLPPAPLQPRLGKEVQVTSLFVIGNNLLLAGTLAHGVQRLNLTAPNRAWESKSGLPASPNSRLTLQPGEQALFSFVQPASTSATYQITNLPNIEVKVAQPVLPLTPCPITTGQCTLAPGPVILSLKNSSLSGAAATVLNIRVTHSPTKTIDIT
jgi:photosystem II stability/assembly factor-like uncharacterized protein